MERVEIFKKLHELEELKNELEGLRSDVYDFYCRERYPLFLEKVSKVDEVTRKQLAKFLQAKLHNHLPGFYFGGQ